MIEIAKKYSCKLEISNGVATADMGSIIDMLRLQVKMGDEVTISADGEGEEEALQEIVTLIGNKFGEE